MNVQYISAGEDAGHSCLKAIVHNWATCHWVDGHPGALAQFIFGDQSAREEQRVAGVALLGARDRFAVHTDCGDRNRRNTLLSLDVDDGVIKL